MILFSLSLWLWQMCKRIYEMPPLSQELLCNIIYNDSFQTSLT